MATEITNVTLEAEHVPELHRPDGVHGSGDTQELPGTVDVFLVINGGRLLLTQFKAGKVFAAIEQAQQSQSQSDGSGTAQG